MTWGELKKCMEKHSMPDDTELLVVSAYSSSWSDGWMADWDFLTASEIHIHYDSQVVYLGGIEE